MRKELSFERIDTPFGDYFFRARVPCGWLVTVVSNASTNLPDGVVQWQLEWRTSCTFVFDPFHRWEVKILERN